MATWTVRAKSDRVKGATQLGFVFGVPGQSAKLVGPVCELTLVAVFACPTFLVGPTQFGLVPGRIRLAIPMLLLGSGGGGCSCGGRVGPFHRFTHTTIQLLVYLMVLVVVVGRVQVVIVRVIVDVQQVARAVVVIQVVDAVGCDGAAHHVADESRERRGRQERRWWLGRCRRRRR